MLKTPPITKVNPKIISSIREAPIIIKKPEYCGEAAALIAAKVSVEEPVENEVRGAIVRGL